MPEQGHSPRQALNKAFLKLRPKRLDFDRFRAAALALLDGVRTGESEEFHKNLISDFLKRSYYSPTHSINTRGRSDLVIHNGKTTETPVGVLFEVKSPTNAQGMPSRDSLGSKACQELLLYYLRERVTKENIQLRHLVITNVDEWFIFDATDFERLFYEDRQLLTLYRDFEAESLAGRGTEFFYREIAAPALARAQPELPFTHFKLQEFASALRDTSAASEKQLIVLFKILSPEHLLKVPFESDAQTLDPAFYSELLHIIGLEEVKVRSKKLIQRKETENRDAGSLLENTISQLQALDRLATIERPEQFGRDADEQLFNAALELVITWIDRIIFLKLLEAQLIRYRRRR